MAKSQLFQPGPANWIFSHGGVFPVRRGHHDEEAFTNAFKILDRGGAVVMYCEGGRSRTGKLADEAKPGIGRLALESGAPVVPVAILGSHQVRNWKRLQFPKVTIQYGEPFKFARIADPTREQQQERRPITSSSGSASAAHRAGRAGLPRRTARKLRARARQAGTPSPTSATPRLPARAPRSPTRAS